MTLSKPLLIALSMLVLCPLQALAQAKCNAYYAFDGNLEDTGGNGYDGTMIAANGGSGTAQFGEGHTGQALILDGTAAMRALIDLHYESCPQITITAWISAAGDRPKGSQYIFSTGSGSGPGLSAAANRLTLNGTANGIGEPDALRDRAGWTFVAGVYDYTNKLYRLHWRNRSRELPLGDSLRPPEDAFWVGAFNDAFKNVATGIAIDELRIYDKALTEENIAQIIAATAPAPGGSGRFAPSSNPALVGAACNSHEQCGARNYCAWDGTCHPESHAPRQALELMQGTAPVEGFILDENARTEGEAPAPAANRSPVPVGSPSFTGVAGHQGDNQRRLDMADKYLHQIGWTDGADVPCRLHVNPRIGLAEQPDEDGMQVEFDCGSTPFPLFADPHYSVELETSVIASVAVCSGLTSQRLKGIRISGNVVRDDGSVVYEPASDEEALARCGTWSSLQLCGADQVATGVVVHSNDRSGEKETIVGLQLICRSVGMR